jgi:hypothetical protein
MSKPLKLNDHNFTAPPVPQVAVVPAVKEKRGREAAPVKLAPLQVRWPESEIKTAKLAAIQQDFPTISEFMLACLHEVL